VDKIKALLEELAAVVAEMEAMTEDAPEGEAPAEPMTEEQEASLRSLEAKADKLKERIEFLQRVQAKELELRSVLERSAPAKKIEATEETPAVESRKAPVFAIPKSSRPLKGFRSEERAYRAGMAIRAGLLGDDEARRWCADHGVQSRAQAGGINSLGGVLTTPRSAFGQWLSRRMGRGRTVEGWLVDATRRSASCRPEIPGRPCGGEPTPGTGWSPAGC